jgi:hypothetical protein
MFGLLITRLIYFIKNKLVFIHCFYGKNIKQADGFFVRAFKNTRTDLQLKTKFKAAKFNGKSRWTL